MLFHVVVSHKIFLFFFFVVVFFPFFLLLFSPSSMVIFLYCNADFLSITIYQLSLSWPFPLDLTGDPIRSLLNMSLKHNEMSFSCKIK